MLQSERKEVKLGRMLLAGVAAVTLLTAAMPAGPVVVSGRCNGCKDVPFELGDIHFVTEQEGWSSAYSWPSDNGSGLATFLRTTDGGRHWRRLPFVWQQGAESGPPYSFVGKRGWLAWYDGDKFEHRFSRTNDGGRTWKHRPSPSLSDLGFFDDRDGYSVEAGNDDWYFRITHDGGETWSKERLPVSSVGIVSFADRNRGILIGADQVPHGAPVWNGVLRVLVTSDGGAHWTRAQMPERPYADPHTCTWVDSRTAFLALWGMNDTGTELLQTTDGGQSWTRHPDASLQGTAKYISAISIAPDGRGYLFFEHKKNRYIATTTDRGATWKSAPFPYRVSSCQLFNGQVLCSSGMKIVKLNLPATPD